jgi:hypothetical protein
MNTEMRELTFEETEAVNGGLFSGDGGCVITGPRIPQWNPPPVQFDFEKLAPLLTK